jgi:hypothetical protein
MQISIHVKTSKGPRSFSIAQLPCTIGSDPRDGVYLKHPSVHPGHAVVTKGRDGFAVLAPRAGQVHTAEGPIDGPVVLRDGARFKVGGVGIEVRIARPRQNDVPASSVDRASPRAVQPGTAVPIARPTPTIREDYARGSSPPTTPTRPLPSRMVLGVYVSVVMAALGAASIPLYLLYGRYTSNEASTPVASPSASAESPKVAGEGGADASGAKTDSTVAAVSQTDADSQASDVVNLLRMSERMANGPRGNRKLDADGMLREVKGYAEVYREFHDSLRELKDFDNRRECATARDYLAAAELIAERFERRIRGESVALQVEALERSEIQVANRRGDLERIGPMTIFAELVDVPAQEIRDDIVNGRLDQIWQGWSEREQYEDAWAIGRFGQDGTRARLAKGIESARAVADGACQRHERRKARFSSAARALVILETQQLFGPELAVPDANSLTYVQREQLKESFELWQDKKGSTLDRIKEIEAGIVRIDIDPPLRAYLVRIQQLSIRSWWFRVPALRAALDASVAYAGEEPEEWVRAFGRSMSETPKADVADIARRRWELDGGAEHQRRYAGTKYEGPGLDGYERETPAWLEQTILGDVLLKSRRDPRWRARVEAEAPQLLKSIEPWLGPVLDGTDLESERSSLDPAVPPPPPPSGR